MSNFAILRIQKLKSPASVARSLRHSFREKDTPNADPQRLLENDHFGASNSAQAMAKFREALPSKIRKNAVQCVEYLITASPETMQRLGRPQQDEYFQRALKWLKKRHGEKNVFYAGIHRDETTPHMYAYVVPMVKKKVRGKEKTVLCAKEFFGGKKALSEMQTDFWKNVGSYYQMDRGIERSKAKHKSIREYYAHINAAVDKKLPELDPKTSPNRKKLNLFSDPQKAYDQGIEDANHTLNKQFQKLSAQVESSKMLSQALNYIKRDYKSLRGRFDELNKNYNELSNAYKSAMDAILDNDVSKLERIKTFWRGIRKEKEDRYKRIRQAELDSIEKSSVGDYEISF